SNFENVVKMARNVEDISKVKLILNESHPNKDLEVPDPYYGGHQGFDYVMELIMDGCQNLFDEMCAQLQSESK
ncbi:MAG: low molecular weight phosphotyrosine protein phosphatase, partial [Opitutales bacterium]